MRDSLAGLAGERRAPDASVFSTPCGIVLELAAAVPSEAASPDSLPDSVPITAASDEPQAA